MGANRTGKKNDEVVKSFNTKYKEEIVLCDNEATNDSGLSKAKENECVLWTAFTGVPVRATLLVILIGLLFIYTVFIEFNLLTHNNVSMDTSEEIKIESGGVLKVDKVVSCYYNMPSPGASSQLRPSAIHPHLCTHINVAFAQIRNKVIYLDHEQYESLTQVVMLKRMNPNLKILLSIGGAGNDTGFPNMVINHASRKAFIKSVKTVLRTYGLDGIDLDWEFPMVHVDDNIYKRQRQHFSQLLREIRMEYIREKKDYLLSLAVAAPETIVDVAYDVDQINLYVDYVNVMTYDFHAFTKYTPFTGLNSPLYRRNIEQMYLATLNINYTVHMYLDKGLDRSKIVVGIPTYGHSFTLVNANNGQVGSPAAGYGTLGGLGFVNYPDICKFIAKFRSEVVIQLDPDARVPYLQREAEWISYDTPQSAMEKANYIKEQNLRGAMIYSLNADDYEGVCDEEVEGSLKFPLAVSVKHALADKVKSN
ncbi:PREDICTED: chitinase-3-like protein 1 [Papilio xuthus]|uniref:Chitinase-3-like protein 1 n=1 Tax=Papilio xuthus TaxID=66420 RepID=A0AAJ7EHV7_PAPXU|nr:PREDICTED: chitinase-3-like protein 1 [Papilio xuthus]